MMQIYPLCEEGDTYPVLPPDLLWFLLSPQMRTDLSGLNTGTIGAAHSANSTGLMMPFSPTFAVLDLFSLSKYMGLDELCKIWVLLGGLRESWQSLHVLLLAPL